MSVDQLHPMTCAITGCCNTGRHNLGVRLRRPDTSAIWAPNTDGFLCDEHATSGVRITMVVEATTAGTVETHVSGGGAARHTRIAHTVAS
jgi:hypothetical protein